MNIREYISSGILELYVMGALTEKESAEVAEQVRKYPELEKEVEAIERTLIDLSGAAAPTVPKNLFDTIRQKLNKDQKVIPLKEERNNWLPMLGWAASILLLVGMFFLFRQNQQLKDDIRVVQEERTEIEQQMVDARNDAEKAAEFLEVLRERNIVRVPLPGQAIAPEAYATAYWNQEENVTYIDAKNLPEPPRGMVYQVWSLKMNPLTPESIGLLDEFDQNETRIFKLENVNASEGFGITLEPAGGSETPTLEKLYVLGAV